MPKLSIFANTKLPYVAMQSIIEIKVLEEVEVEIYERLKECAMIVSSF